MSTTAPRIRELPIPAAPGADGWADFVAVTTMAGDIESVLLGTRDLNYPPEVELAQYHLQDQEPRKLFIAESAGRLCGIGRIQWTLEEDDEASWVSVLVPEVERRRGIGAALLDRLIDESRAVGRAVVQTWTANPVPSNGTTLPARSGHGRIETDQPGPRALLGRGWTLEQVERVSRVALPAAPVAAADIDDAYTIVSWSGPTPAEWEKDVALLHSAISVDAPSAGLSSVAEQWTLEHLRARDRMHNAAGMRELTVAAVHAPSGRLAGYSSLDLFDDRSRPALQNDTVVLREHRGHRLGMRLKLAGFELVERTAPSCGAIYTWNAEENRHMLSVNEDVGFVAVAAEGLWKKVLT